MCGIAGVVTSEDLIASALKDHWGSSLSVRGPDGSGVFSQSVNGWGVHLLHWRLALIGLGLPGRQPISDRHERFTLIFNGEIYNFRELASTYLVENSDPYLQESDTAVLLALWEKFQLEALPLLKGMFAIAVLDSKKHEITLARDQFGIKPLYYKFTTNHFAFSSDPSNLWSAESTVNQSTVGNFILEDRYDIPPETFVNDVQTLEPGQVVNVKLDNGLLQLFKKTWFRVDMLEMNESRSAREVVEKTRQLFMEAVDAVMTADVPMAFALSGGIDSSAAICCARLLRPNMPLTAFVYAPPDQEGEIFWAKQVADHVGATLVIVRPSAAELENALDDVVRAQKEPIDHTRFLAQYFVFQSVARRGFKILIEGQGADEILGGYAGFPSARIISSLRRMKFLDLIGVVGGLRVLSRQAQLFTWGSILISLSTKFPSTRHKKWLVARGAGHRLSDFVDLKSTSIRSWLKSDFRRERVFKKLNYYNRVLASTSFFELLPRLLRHGDRNAMAHSIENRVPFLYQPFALHCLGIDERFLFKGGADTKYVFKAAMRGIVPDVILDRKDKVGFTGQLSISIEDSRENVPGLPAGKSLTGDQKVREILLKKWFIYFNEVRAG